MDVASKTNPEKVSWKQKDKYGMYFLIYGYYLLDQ